ncbi:MAG: hypothetical protein LBB83_03530, partial [Treponema sp.]|nr:hypothetical protein [Treponema sp.]
IHNLTVYLFPVENNTYYKYVFSVSLPVTLFLFILFSLFIFYTKQGFSYGNHQAGKRGLAPHQGKTLSRLFSRAESAYIIRTDNGASLSIGDVRAALKTEAGSPAVNLRLGPVRVCGDFAVNTGCFSVYPNAGGTFDRVTEGHDTEKHPVTFRTRAPLRTLTENTCQRR